MKGGLGGIEFEIEVQARFDALGWSVERTAVSGDFGADLVARADSEMLVVQCKDYGSPAGISAVQEVHFARVHYGASAAAVVARNGFTRAAIRAAATSGVHLFRPADVATGSAFDRTLLKEEIERREWIEYRARGNDRKSEIWKQYDVAKLRYNTRVRNRPCWSGAIFVAAILWICITISGMWNGSDYQDIAGLVCLQAAAFFAVWRVSRPSPPPEPGFARRDSIITCPTCKQKLRIDFGKEGSVRCPRCRNFTAVSALTVGALRREDDVDANFFLELAKLLSPMSLDCWH